MSIVDTAGATDVVTFWSLDFDHDKKCEHDLHDEGKNGHADGDMYYCVLSCACTEKMGVVIRCGGFIEWAIANDLVCNRCGQNVPEGWPWHIIISKVD